MLDRWPIRNKLLVGLVLLLVMVGTLAVSSFHGVYAYRSLIKGIGWRANELPLASELNLRVSDLRVGLHGSPRMTEFGLAPGHLSTTAAQMARLEFRENLEGVEKALEKYRKQLEQNHEYGSRIDDSQREWQNVRKIERSLARIHSIDQSDDWYFNKLKLGELSGELEELQKEAGDLPLSLHQSIREFTGDVRLRYRTMIVLAWIASVSAMLMLAVFVHLFYQWVFRPLRILIKGSRKVAAGMFDFRIHLDTHDEMSELADALNDMTSRFRAIRDDLDRQVQERTKQVVRSEQLASVGFLAAGVAHEINNPLASIALCAESLESRVHELLPTEHEENALVVNYLKMIQSEAFRCKEITEKLLDFSRMGDSKRTRGDLRELVQSVVDMVGHLGKYQEKNLTLLPGEPLYALINPQEIKQVVLNLITNGLDSLDPGGTVKIELRQDRDCAEIAFVDNGCGMTHEVLNHLFEPFFTRRRGGQGTGLGLSISYRIVVDHDGHIEASSEGPGRGAQFIPPYRWLQTRRRKSIATKPPKGLKVLFADDEKSLQQLMSIELPRMGHEVTVCPDGLTAVAALKMNTYDCIVVDLDMPGLNGIEVIGQAKQMSPETEAVVLTGKSSLETAIAALRHGAFDYLTKPCKLVEIDALLKQIIDKRALTNKYLAAKRRLEKLEGSSQLIGSSLALDRVRQLIAKVAPTDSTVLILGETGTGKELVARALHDQSLRSEAPFVAINCGALPESLIESELFGHRKGAFTGAEEHRTGLFEVANGGTLFLDEIGELPRAMQAKLLRFLESGEIRRVGENQSHTVNVRVVCATLRNLEEMVAADEFREDLMFRINTFEIQLPALRDRLTDVPDLAEHLLRRCRPNLKPNDTLFSEEAVATLLRHNWPGNVRELANVVEHAAILSQGELIGPEHLPSRFDGRKQLRGPHFKMASPVSLRELEMQAIQQSLERHAGNKPKAAEELGISLKTLYNKLSQLTTGETAA